jgi:secondary thiamine-phosphate synthase enzyme
MAAMASAVSGMSAVCHKEGTGPCKRYATYYVAHITASVFINDDERGLHADYEDWLEELAPHAPIGQYRHNRTGEDNADAHLKRQIMGREVVVAITGGRLDFGPWEQIFYGEFDGKRRKRVLVKIMGE